MSTENLNEIITHQICHNDDILEHIDDESQQEYVEKMAPKAQEEILVINQDCDSSPTYEVNSQLMEIDQTYNTETMEENQDEATMNKDAPVDKSEDDIQHFKETDVEENVMTDETDVKDNLEQPEIKYEQLCESVIIEESQLMEKSELTEENEIKDVQILESDDIEEAQVNYENSEETELNKEQLLEANVTEQSQLEIDVMNVECREDDVVGETEATEDPELKDEIKINDEHKTEFYENVHNLEDKTLKNDKSEITEPSKVNVKDVKALSSTYNNEDTVNSDCEICKKTVYPLEKLSANDRIFHKQCFKCSKCRCALLSGNFSFNNDKPYCRPHYIELFKKRGRYDEIDDGEATSQQTINDILTDELPAPDITKNLLAKFRDLEAGAGTTASVATTNADGTNELPAPNTTKNLMERFSALGKDNDRDQKRKPMIEIPRSGGNGHNFGACENNPASLPKDVARANEPSHDEMPEQGITKNLVNRFRDLESTGVASK